MPTLENIPQEIFLSILDCIGQDAVDLRPYVTVSRRWQKAVERLTFESLSIKNTDLPAFAKLFRSGQTHRKALVKDVYLHIVLPEYDGENCHQHKEANNQLSSDAVLELFQVLETFNDDEDVKMGDGISLCLTGAASPSDQFYLKIASKIWSEFIYLSNHERLPTLSCVSRFQSGHSFNSRKFDPASIMYAAGKLKGLKGCWIDFCNEREYVDHQAQIKLRHGAYDGQLHSYSTHS